MPENTRPRGATRRVRRAPKSAVERHPAPEPTTTLTLDSYAPTGFADLGVPPDVDAGLAAAGFSTPFAIQTMAIPVALTGKDVCGRAKTGSGKTLAFGVPMLARLTGPGERRRPRGLVLVPTRELALQVSEVLSPVAIACGHTVLAVYGGASRSQQIDALEIGVDVVVATPLRLIDLLKEDELDLSGIEIVVLDEADRMADDGFTPQVEWILRKVTGPHQTMLFSATLDGDVDHLVRRYMQSPGGGVRRRGHRHRRHDAPPVPRRAPHGPRPRRGDDRRRLRQDAGVLPDQARLRPRRAQPPRARACRPWRSTATWPRWPASGR